MSLRLFRTGALAGLLLPCGALAQAPAQFDLSVPSIMRGPELVGNPPSNVQWSDDGRWIFFRWTPGGRPWHEQPALYRVAATGGTPVKLSPEAADSLGVLIAPGPRSPDDRWRAVAYRGDLFLIDRKSGGVRRLTDTRATETNPVFSLDGRTLYFSRDNNIFALHLADGTLRQMTDVRPAPQPERTAQGQRRFLEDQQRELFEHIRLEERQREEQQALTKARESRELAPIYLANGERQTGLRISPAGTFVFLSANRGGGTSARRTMVPDWVTRTGYTEPLEVRTKVGDQLPGPGRIAIATIATGDAQWLNIEKALQLDSTKSKIGTINFLDWSPDGTKALVGILAVDFKDQWLLAIDAPTGAITQLAHERNNAWIGGPCNFWGGCAGWLPDGRVYYATEKDGYSHVYVVNADGTGERQLTRGEWEVQSVQLSPAKDHFYLQTNEGSPHEVHFWHMNFDGSNRTQITTMAGRQDVTPSPDGKRIAIVHSFANVPPELFVGENRANAKLTQITDSPTDEWKSQNWIAPEIIRFQARDGVMVPARIYRPRDLGAQPNGAAVIFVHGAGYLQNVHNWWSTYYREYMFHHVLASKGYVVLDIDYRGSAGYGAAWRTAIYRHMGGKDLTDQVDGVKYLAEHEGVDAQRVGIYGGSYGGFITLMALFTQGEHFAAGAALRAVTDWAHYNHGYTARILNQPQDDTTAYKQSSPIYFAEGLNDPLLIAHGMVDTNVHFSDVVRLAQRLIELGKTSWEMAVYPVEDHGFVEPTSWTDEYRRIVELFDRHLLKPWT